MFRRATRKPGDSAGTTSKRPLPMEEADPFFLEQFKALRAKFEYKADMLNLRAVAVTSAVAGEGKTMSCANLARNLALSGRKRVLAVDVDLRKADLGREFGVPSLPGLSEMFAGTVDLPDILRDGGVPGLQVVPAGTRISTAGDLLAGPAFRAFLARVRKAYDIVLLDTPPILPVADTLSLRDQVDAFLFLYRAGFTPYPMLQQALEEVGERNVLGVVINGVEPRAVSYYQRYYGAYYTAPGRRRFPPFAMGDLPEKAHSSAAAEG